MDHKDLQHLELVSGIARDHGALDSGEEVIATVELTKLSPWPLLAAGVFTFPILLSVVAVVLSSAPTFVGVVAIVATGIASAMLPQLLLQRNSVVAVTNRGVIVTKWALSTQSSFEQGYLRFPKPVQFGPLPEVLRQKVFSGYVVSVPDKATSFLGRSTVRVHQGHAAKRAFDLAAERAHAA